MTTQEHLKEVLDYNPKTGIFVWKIATSRKMRAGAIAGYLNNRGYVQICDRGVRYMAHRLAWLFTYGKLPSNWIDHINGIRNDNRIENLRDVSKLGNNQNQTKAHRDSECGLLGVRIKKSNGKYIAAIKTNGKSKHLGTFLTKEEAHQAYVAAKRIHHPTCTL